MHFSLLVKICVGEIFYSSLILRVAVAQSVKWMEFIYLIVTVATIVIVILT